MSTLKSVAVAAFLAICGISTSMAQTGQTPLSQEQIERELAESWRAAAKVAVHGPKAASLGAQGSIQVPKGMAFIPTNEAGRILRALGNSVSPYHMGMVTSTDDNDNWFATVSFKPDGYIRDDDAKEWNADELLQHLRNGTEHDNRDRKARGFPELEITGWIERPAYSSQTHQLIWSAGLRNKGEAGGAQTVNYNTYLLGREGYFSLNFVTGANLIEAEKPIARGLLAAMQFTVGKRYDDFNASTDKVAAYGLAALVGGAVLKKAGILAVVTAFFAKFAKLFLVLGGVLLVGIFNLLRRKPSGKA